MLEITKSLKEIYASCIDNQVQHFQEKVCEN